MAANLPYHFHYHEDALNGFRSLTLEERGAYVTIIELLYKEGDYLRENERILAAEMNVSLRKYKALRLALMEKGKIYYVAPGMLSNRRFEKEMEKRSERAMQAAKNGSFGGKKKAENEKFRKQIKGGAYPTSSSSQISSKFTNSEFQRNSEGVIGGAGQNEPAHVVAFRARDRARKWR